MSGISGEHKAALVTGGARRVGRAIALRLADAGFAVAIHCNRSRQDAETLHREIESRGRRCVVATANLSRVTEAEAMLRDCAAAIGPLTLLVNNAAMFEGDDIASLDLDLWERQFTVNLTTPVFLAKAFAAQAPTGSSIVNVLDQRTFKPTPHFVSYALSKAALHHATLTLAQALAPDIRVNGVAPGPTLPSYRQSEQDFALQQSRLPLGRGAPPEEIADAVLFLAQSSGITGTVIPVDGGQHIAWETPDIAGIRE